MKGSRTWPVLTGLLLLLVGALWLEAISRNAAATPDLIVISDPTDDSAGPRTDWQFDQPRSEVHERARVHALHGDYTEALKLLEEVRSVTPTHAMAWAESGHWARRAGNLASALEFLVEASRLAPEDPRILVERAIVLDALERPQEAETAYREAVARRPMHTPTRILLGKLLVDLGRYTEAIEVLHPACDRGSNEERTRALIAVGRIRIRLGELKQARRDLNQATERTPAMAGTWIAAARALLESPHAQDHRQALDYARRGIALAPDDAAGRSVLAQGLERDGKATDALDAYRECLRLAPHNEYARKRALRIALDSEDFSEARRHANAMLRQSPNDKESHFLAGLVEARAVETGVAREHYQHAIEVAAGNYPEASYNLGLLERAAGNQDASVAAYRRAIELRPDYASAWNNLGVVLSEFHQGQDALAAFEKAIALDPSMSSAWHNLAKHHAADGHHAEAVRAYREEIARGETDRSTRLNLGVELRKSGDAAEASRVYESLVREFPRYVQAWYNLGVARAALGDVLGARRAYEQALGLDRHHRKSIKNLGLLLAHEGQLDSAFELLHEAVEIQPDDEESRLALARLYSERGDQAGCAREARRAAAAAPGSKDAQTTLRLCTEKM